MSTEYWHRQQTDKPLFPSLEWSRPENRLHAGKLLIIGGNLHGFAAPAEAYNESERAGIGRSKVVLPSAIQKIIGTLIEDGEFTSSTPSGSFGRQALADILDWAKWADGVLFAGDMGRNSETAIVIESYLQKSEKPTVITKDAIDYVTSASQVALMRPNTTLVLSLSQLQRLGTAAKFEQAITFSMDLIRLVEWLHIFTGRYAPNIIVKHLDTILVAVNGEVSTTKLVKDIALWRVKTAATSAVWWIQNQGKTFEALTSAVFMLNPKEAQ